MDVLHLAQDHPVAAVAIVGLVLWAVYTATTAQRLYPDDLPWVGRKEGTLFSTTRATFGSLVNIKTWLGEGYQKVRRTNIEDPTVFWNTDISSV